MPPALTEAAARIQALGWAGAVYTSHSHTPAAPRNRIVLPLSDEIAPTLPAPEAAADLLDLLGVLDRSKFGASSLFYLPSGRHEAAVIEGAPSDAAWMTVRAGAILAAREAEQQRQREIALEAASKRRECRLKAGLDPDASIIEAVRKHLDLGGSGDPLAAGNLPSWCRAKAIDVVDMATILDHGSDRKVALRVLAKRFGIKARTPAARSGPPLPNGKGDHEAADDGANGQTPPQEAKKPRPPKPPKPDPGDDGRRPRNGLHLAARIASEIFPRRRRVAPLGRLYLAARAHPASVQLDS